MHSRFKALESFSEDSLEDLKNSRVAVVGLGATGSVIAEHMARHGADLVLIDRDYLEENDLYSSNLYTKEDCEKALPKAEAAAQHLKQFTDVEPEIEHLSEKKVDSLLKDVDIVLDGTDNVTTRIAIDRYCQKEEIPWIFTAAISKKGYSMFLDNKSLSDIFDKVDDLDAASCETEGVMREYSSIAGSRSALKAVKFLAGQEPGEELEAVHLQRSFKVESNENSLELKDEKSVKTVCGKNKFQLNVQLDDNSLENLKDSSDSYRENDYLVKASKDGRNITAFRSGRIIVEAQDEGHARQRISDLIGV